jgi:putative tryptophan/tyrosine transport system substrate-binding protein
MKLRSLARTVACALVLLVAPLPAWGQSGERIPRVGVLLVDTEALGISERARHFVDGLRELGWVDGQSIALRFKFANLNEERLGVLAEELVGERVDLIVAIASIPTRAAQRATRTIPIVMAGTGDPVGSGFVTNLARPETNVTGTSLLIQELGGKRLELLKEAVPGLARVAALYNPSSSVRSAIPELQAGASRIGVELRLISFRGPGALPDQFAELRAARAGALAVSPSPPIDEARSRIAMLALKERLPTMFALREYVEAGD